MKARNEGNSAIAALIWIVAVIGWIMNIVSIVDSVAGKTMGEIEITVMLVLRIIGIFIGPLGAILGFLP